MHLLTIMSRRITGGRGAKLGLQRGAHEQRHVSVNAFPLEIIYKVPPGSMSVLYDINSPFSVQKHGRQQCF